MGVEKSVNQFVFDSNKSQSGLSKIVPFQTLNTIELLTLLRLSENKGHELSAVESSMMDFGLLYYYVRFIEIVSKMYENCAGGKSLFFS